jgi:hypothetical protein
MVKWGSTLNTCVHAYETKTNLSIEAFQLKICKLLCILYILYIFLCTIKVK